jgi:hypothetical protein
MLRNKKLEKEGLKWARDFDKRNRYWTSVFEIMPQELKESIVSYGMASGSFFLSNAIMYWLLVGDKKTLKARAKVLDFYKNKLKKMKRCKQKRV